MGQSFEAECKNCGCQFLVREGGGFFFHLLHCDRCGEEKEISFDEIGEPHLRYIKGLKVPYSIVTSDADNRIQDSYPGEAISEEEYEAIVETLAGRCPCGGGFKFKAEPCCPECHSKNYVRLQGGPQICYD